MEHVPLCPENVGPGLGFSKREKTRDRKRKTSEVEKTEAPETTSKTIKIEDIREYMMKRGLRQRG